MVVGVGSGSWRSSEDWLDKNQHAEADEFKNKQEELEGVVKRFLNDAYGNPTVEEAD